MSGRRRILLVVAAAAAIGVGGLVAWWVKQPLEILSKVRRAKLARAGFVEQTVPVAGGSVRLFERGSGPTLLFLHGVGNDAGAWSGVAARLAEQYRVVLVDLPGHAGAEPTAGELPMATVIAGAEVALAATGAEPLTVVGNSLGAWLGFILAERFPERVERLVAIGGGPLPGEAGGPSLSPKTREEAAALMARVVDRSSRPMPGYVLDDLIRRASSGPIGRLSADVPGLVAALWTEERLTTLSTPVELLWGASDGIVPPAYADRLLELLPRARRTTIETCGHVPQLECPERFLEALLSVLERELPPEVRPEASGLETLPSPDLTHHNTNRTFG